MSQTGSQIIPYPCLLAPWSHSRRSTPSKTQQKQFVEISVKNCLTVSSVLLLYTVCGLSLYVMQNSNSNSTSYQ